MKASHFAASLISRLILRSKKILVFTSFPDYTDNAYAMYKYLTWKRKGKYRCIWLYSDRETAKKFPIGVQR